MTPQDTYLYGMKIPHCSKAKQEGTDVGILPQFRPWTCNLEVLSVSEGIPASHVLTVDLNTCHVFCTGPDRQVHCTSAADNRESLFLL
jgi:hypothetical protein